MKDRHQAAQWREGGVGGDFSLFLSSEKGCERGTGPAGPRLKGWLMCCGAEMGGRRMEMWCYKYSRSRAWWRAMRSEWLEILQKGMLCCGRNKSIDLGLKQLVYLLMLYWVKTYLIQLFSSIIYQLLPIKHTKMSTTQFYKYWPDLMRW